MNNILVIHSGIKTLCVRAKVFDNGVLQNVSPVLL